MFGHQARQRIHQRAGAAHGEVHAVRALEKMDQTVDAGGIERVATHQQRLDRESLADLVVLHATRNHLPYRPIGAQAKQLGHLPEHEEEAVEWRVREFGEAHVVDLARLLEQCEIAVGIRRVDAGDLGQGLLDATAVVEVVSVVEVEPVPELQRYDPDVVGDVFAKQREQLLEQERRGQHRGPGVVPEPVLFEHLRAPPEPHAAVDQRDFMALRPRPQRGGDAAETSADHHDVAHAVSSVADNAADRRNACAARSAPQPAGSAIATACA